jgi:translation initiation factor IF-3
VVDPEGKQLGIMSREAALKLAAEYELDLVEVSAKSVPPVCRIMDYGKFRYQQSKKVQEARKKQSYVQVKEVKVRPKTDEHDLQIKIRQMKDFLGKGHKVKVSLMFRGREISHPELAQRVISRITEGIQDVGNIEMEPRLEGRFVTMVVAPRSG